MNWSYLSHGYLCKVCEIQKKRESLSMSKCETFNFIVLSGINNVESWHFTALIFIKFKACQKFQ